MKKLLRVILFILGFLIIFIPLSNVFILDSDSHYYAEEGFYEEKENSLDAVFIGSSNVHSFWQPPLAWEDRGIAAFSYSISSMPPRAILYMMKEARKTQPDALYIINANSLGGGDNVTDVSIYAVADNLHFSKNKIELINKLADDAGIYGLDRLQLFFPFIRFHGKWPELTSWDFDPKTNGLKNARDIIQFRRDSVDITADYNLSEASMDLTERQMEILTELLDYCEENHVNVLFFTGPQGNSETRQRKNNRVCEIITERGFRVLDLKRAYREIGLQLEKDFLDRGHTNVHGSIKFTDYLAGYLAEHYGFADKRGNPDYKSWDEAARLYHPVIDEYTLDIERTHALRDYTLRQPAFINVNVASDGKILVQWEEIEEADGYYLYRNPGFNNSLRWELVSEFPAKDETRFIDDRIEEKGTYNYTVVPFRDISGNKYFGNFDYKGNGISLL